MRFDVVTLFPEMVDSAARYGVTGRAIEQGIVDLKLWNPRDWAPDRHRTVDDRPYGGGPGMVMKVEPLRSAIRAARADSDLPAKTIYLSPQGGLLTQDVVVRLARCPRLILVAGRYEGVDERLIELEIDEEWSIGDYVLSGGELAVLVMFDAVVRLLPGVLGHADSAVQDSHMAGLLDCPHYTRPEVVDGRRVPQVLQSGDHGAIRRWRLKQSLGRTWLRRPDLLAKLELDAEQRSLLEEFKHEFYAGTN
ncbi:tRNA (guanosine(37)-N1)-methyltransferase TrmD [Methylocaldum szegediense]|jgi:tRNA (guanine37-N1)-methyltransferase|uniref:tRNA (guanine-N(1)-)-methyltransferase n=1 Tax=Methylocaldum szegediense TaxID=73780 RepID=A0ABM9I603_9GAMM|nr:tRNA (guanosine(37)-N1)-methyltransferase TrmD [Methylocaldum szegediense]CAI8910815.1 tRNA m(1)G37 methyltransferase [Methylocaldum szegediense]